MIGIVRTVVPVLLYEVAIYLRLNAAGGLDHLSHDALLMLIDPHRLLNQRAVGVGFPNFGGLPGGGGNLTLNPLDTTGLINVVPESITLPDHIFPP